MKTALTLPKINEVTQKIAESSSEMVAITTSTALASFIRGRDAIASSELQKLFSHYASIHSPQALVEELRLLGKDLEASAPQTTALMRELAGLRKNLLKRTIARLNPPPPAEEQT